MQILLEKPELEQYVRSQVDGGRYASPAAVIEAALSKLILEEFPPGEIDRLIAEGEASVAKHGPLNGEDAFRDLKEMHRAARIKAGK